MISPKFKRLTGHHSYGHILDKNPNDARTPLEAAKDNDTAVEYERGFEDQWEPMEVDSEPIIGED